jgi:lipopolysaccharide transport system ATP-binding protein
MLPIEVNHVSKVYRIYRKPSDRLREMVLRKPFHHPFPSLNDVSFSVPFGQSLGIIGDNGAGKSTLLKVLAGTLTPTSGQVIMRGRTAALLELGAGFQPEFTGLQNIHLNASLLGLTASEIEEKLPSIVSFAELGDFIDRPLKTYSSGMVVRLAFSIATSVDPDILIIDEALSVGDQYFQEKCMRRMQRFRDDGKVIVFCSHAIYVVNQLCRHTIWLDQGRIREQGPTSQVTAAYENHLRQRSAGAEQEEQPSPDAPRATPLWIRSIRLNDQESEVELAFGQDVVIVVEYESMEDRAFWVAAGIKRNDDLILHAVSMARDFPMPISGKGVGQVVLRYPAFPLLQGKYAVVASLLDQSGLHCYHSKESASFSIRPSETWQNEIGVLHLRHEWKVEHLQ